ncbi:MAG: hypothetical protein LC754_19095 [Acidobacteria bacterium]|nr:hypothetical protein [Acidobacteriota bacterium]
MSLRLRLIIALLTFLAGVSVVAVWTVRRRHVNPRPVVEPALQKTEPSALVYVLDSNNGETEAQILLVDAERGSIVRRFPVGYNPAMALAPDGRRLYVEETTGGAHRLSVLDAATGENLRSVNDPLRMMYKVIPQAPSAAVSADGRWLYVQKYTYTKGAEDAVYWLETFDMERGVFLPETVPLPKGGVGLIVPSGRSRELLAIPASSREVRLLKLAESGALESSAVFKLPPDLAMSAPARFRPDGVVDACYLRDGQMLFVTRFGRLFKIDSGGRVLAESALWDSEGGDWINVDGATVSPDGGRLFVAIDGPALVNHQTREVLERARGEVAVVETGTLKRLGTIETSRPVRALEMSRDGSRLYALDWKAGKLSVIDAATARELRSIGGLGRTPSLLIAAPMRP